MKQKSGLWKLQVADFVKGLWLSVGSAVIAFGYFIIRNHFVLPTMEQASPYLETIGAGFLTYIGKNWSTNNFGQFLKKDVPIKVVPADAVVVPGAKMPDTNIDDISTLRKNV